MAALGVSLTIPLAMLEDVFIHHQHYSKILFFQYAIMKKKYELDRVRSIFVVANFF